MKILGTDFIAYQVSDLKRATTFYRDVLGLRQTEYKEEWEWAEFDCGNVTLTLFSGNAIPESNLGGSIGLAVPDIEEAYQELKEKRVDIQKKPYELSACWHLELRDPDRNLIIIHKRKDGTVGPGTQPNKSAMATP